MSYDYINAEKEQQQQQQQQQQSSALVVEFPLSNHTACLSLYDVTAFDEPRQLFLRASRDHNLPVYIEQEVTNAIGDALRARTQHESDSLAETYLNECDIPTMAHAWTAAYTTEYSEYAEKVETTANTNFPYVYHRLIHSAASETLLQLEESYSIAVEELRRSGRRTIGNLKKKQMLDLDTLMSSLPPPSKADMDIVAQRHLEDLQLLHAKWASEISDTIATQRRDYRAFVSSYDESGDHMVSSRSSNRFHDSESDVDVVDAAVAASKLSSTSRNHVKSLLTSTSDITTDFRDSIVSTSSQLRSRATNTASRIVSMFAKLGGNGNSGSSTDVPGSVEYEGDDDDDDLSDGEPTADSIVLEESFTVHLGTQMKVSHNLRLVAANANTLLRHPRSVIADVSGMPIPQPLRVHMSMTLYSRSLSGMVILVDGTRSFYESGIGYDFVVLCEQTADFHFADIQLQLANAFADLEQRPDQPSNFLAGEFFVTRHSNLANAHCVFHLVVGSDVVAGNTLTSRSAGLIGLRNVLSMAAKHDFTSIIVPLLLSLPTCEPMSESWSIKRAELILKCVKGFMTESQAWSGTTARTTQFTLPENVPESIFHACSTLITNTFHIARVVNAIF